MANITGSIILAERIKNFWDNRAKKKLNEVIAEAEEILESEHYFGYLVRTDKMGYLRALSKAKYTFRGLNRDDLTEGMIDGEGVNPLFVEMVEDFYYSEIRVGANIYDLKLARYNALRDELIERFEGRAENFTEKYAKNEFNLSRQEMFNKVKNNELVFALSNQNNTWYILGKDRYKKGVENKVANLSVPHFPLELVG
ncbi:hypothetical protein [Helicobacter brantae]|uniref:Uncharacterized protein n=1 Tax=Helicobacter brantae TaxID=375927 RepID=A0A3D8IV94_9HELI|nr:hypothetical protein [Helicobacter brantae]RDU68845.1 hypothetical protein CQA58_07900 [Helicobacter brantae]